jgi:hypothetical protein
VAEERVVGEFEFLLLSCHDIHGVVKHDVGDSGGTRGHEHRHPALKRLKQWEAADVILMGVGQDGGSHLDFLQILQHRRRIVADMLGVHATIEKHGSLGKV